MLYPELDATLLSLRRFSSSWASGKAPDENHLLWRRVYCVRESSRTSISTVLHSLNRDTMGAFDYTFTQFWNWFFNSGMTRMSGFQPCKRTTGIHNAFYSCHVTNEIDESQKEITYTLAIDRAHVDLASRTRRPGRLFARLSHDQTGNTPTVQFWRQN